MNRRKDEAQIRDVISAWMTATSEGNIDLVLELMAEDAIFLTCGQPPMKGRGAFKKNIQKALKQVRIDGKSDIQEIEIVRDRAFCWANLSLTLTPLKGGPATKRKGNTLSVFQKRSDGRWVLFRDANLLGEH